MRERPFNERPFEETTDMSTEILQRALDQHSNLLQSATERWNKSLNEFAEKQRGFEARLFELAQQRGTPPQSGGGGGDAGAAEIQSALEKSRDKFQGHAEP
jgi:hypothetical protein